MVVVPLSMAEHEFDFDPDPPPARPVHWVRIASAATLIASGALLLSGRRKAGLVAAATGTTLALLDQQDALKKWWLVLPGYIGDVQRLLGQAQTAVDEFSVQREKLGNVLAR